MDVQDRLQSFARFGSDQRRVIASLVAIVLIADPLNRGSMRLPVHDAEYQLQVLFDPRSPALMHLGDDASAA